MRFAAQKPILIAIAVLVAVAMSPLTGVSAPDDLADSDIRDALQDELLVDDQVSSHMIDISVVNGIVTLDGTVNHLLAKQRTEEQAESTMGVLSVVNNLDVKAAALADQEIASSVSDALLADPAADSYELDVTADDGVVTLSGNVESFAEKNLALDVAKGVRGVTGVEDEITVDVTYDRPDAEIAAEVERYLESDVKVDAYGIDVTVEDGRAVLSGHVGSSAEKQRAEVDAWAIPGVTAVSTDDLEIKWWARDEMKRRDVPQLADSEIESAIESALLHDPRVSGFDVAVEVEDGSATLTGTVDNLQAKNAAEDDARNTQGVWYVRNYLKVRPDEIYTDAEIRSNIEDVLQLDPYIDRFDISIVVDNQQAELYGTVANDFQRKHAASVATRAKGVVHVDNFLSTLERLDVKEDWELARDIDDQLFWDPRVLSGNVNVSVDDGVATLNGTVLTWDARVAATENAYEAGARRVVNNLEINYGNDYFSLAD